MDRKEHLDWAMARAEEIIAAGDPVRAVTSFVSDMGKHPETMGEMPVDVAARGLTATLGGEEDVRAWLGGFR